MPPPIPPPPSVYPPYRAQTHTPHQVSPPATLGLLPHPNNPAPPQPKRIAPAPLPQGWTRTYHAIPAAYPRFLRESHGTTKRGDHPYGDVAPREGESKAARTARVKACATQVAERRYAASQWTLDQAKATAPPGLFLAAERWTRDTPKGGHTIVCTHPNGAQKEHWHPVLLDLITRPASEGFVFGTTQPLPSTAVEIDDIWLLDAWNHGESLTLNAGLLGPVQAWDDVARDLLSFIIHTLPAVHAHTLSDGATTLPYQLPWTSERSAPPRKVIGFGGSYGGVGHLLAAAQRPDIYTALWVADPMCPPRSVPYKEYKQQGLDKSFVRTTAALKRRDVFPSRASARESWSAIPLFAAFDQTTYDLTINYALTPVDPAHSPDDDTVPVTLATPAWAESSNFTEPFAPGRCWDVLPCVRIPVGFCMARDNTRTFGDDVTRELVWRAPRSRNERMVDADHLIVQEKPAAAAESAYRFLATLGAGCWGEREEILASYEERDKARL